MKKTDSNRKFYFFPITKYKNPEGNTYLQHIITALMQKYEIVNYEDISVKTKMLRLLIFDLWKYRRADVFLLNWTDFIVDGVNIIAFPFYALATCLFRLQGKTIIWFFHDRYSGHSTSNIFLRLLIIKYNAFIASFVVTYSEEGIKFGEEHFSKRTKIYYFPHPIYPEAKKMETEETYDIIIWGLIKPYKHILEFLLHVQKNNSLSAKKILVCGYCPDEDYDKKIKELLTPNITYINSFVSTERLNEYLSASKNILFTYDTETVLCSGALAYSVSFGKKIIGPKVGAFKDYEKLHLASTFNSFDEIESLLSETNPINSNDFEQYWANNTWEKLAEKINIAIGL